MSAMIEDIDEVEVLYDWAPETPEDLRLVAGDIVKVLVCHEHGWWQGQIIRPDGSVSTGYFPRNYVKPRPKNAPQVPPRPESTRNDLSTALENATLDDSNPYEPDPSTIIPHSIKSISAYNDFATRGFTVELEDGTHLSSSTMKTASCQIGQIIDISCKGYIWDASYSTLKLITEGDLRFTLGNHEVLAGIEAAAVFLKEDTSAIVSLLPPFAYGSAGHPPLVPPNSCVVLKIKMNKISNKVDNEVVTASGPAEFMKSDVSASRQGKEKKEGQRNIVLVKEGEENK